MPRKKGGRSGTPDGYSPSPLGEEPRGRSRSPRVGDSPRDSPRGGRSPTREAVPAPHLAPVPSWRGLRACLPRGSEPRAGALEAEPVATGFGAHAHVLLSPRMMTNAGLGPGDWVALAIRGDTGGGGESASDRSVDDETSDAPNAPSAALTSALLARNLPTLCPKERDEDEDENQNVSDERAQLGRHVVLARAHPNAKASSPAAVALARKTWMSLGRPAGETQVWVCPLDVGRLAIGEKGANDKEKEKEKEAHLEEPTNRLAAPSPGASCAFASLRLWATEGDASAGSANDWLERGLARTRWDPDVEGDTSRLNKPGSSKQLAVLESLARRALDGRCLLPGNLVRLPLLGASAFFVVDDAAPGPVGAATEVALRGARDAEQHTRVTRDASRDGESSSSSSTSDGSSDPAVLAAKRARRAGERFASAADANGGYASLGGVDALVQTLRETVELPLTRPELFARCGVRPPRGVLLWGPPGTGKTRLARAAAASARAKLMVVRGPELVTAAVGESEAALRGVFAAAARDAPCVVLLDELDAIAPARAGGDGLGGRGDAGASSEGDEQMSARVVATLLSVLDGAEDERSMRGVVVVATTNRPEAVDRALRRPGRFDREIEVGVPTPSARREILQKHLALLNHSLTQTQADALARDAHGFVGADVAALCAGAAMQALRRAVSRKTVCEKNACESISEEEDKLASALGTSLSLVDTSSTTQGFRLDAEAASASACVTFADFAAARRRVKPSALREVAVETPRVEWDDVGGHEAIKQQLREAVEWQERHGDAMRRVGAVPPSGTLLYGPPGCSKTMLARAVASASGRNFITVKGPELHSKYVGESEKAVRALFARAAASAPSVIFLDELDGLVGRRGSGGGGPSASDRVLTQLLGEMDGLAADSRTNGGDDERKKKSVSVVAATNRPDLVDPALLRPGRFDRTLYVPPPTSAEDRAAILSRAARKTPLSSDVDLSMLALGTAGYTGADLQAFVREAAICALEEDLDAKQVCARHFAAAAVRVPPSPPVSPETAAAYASFERAGSAA